MVDGYTLNAERQRYYKSKKQVTNAVKDLHGLRLFTLKDDVSNVVVDKCAEGPNQGNGNA